MPARLPHACTCTAVLLPQASRPRTATPNRRPATCLAVLQSATFVHLFLRVSHFPMFNAVSMEDMITDLLSKPTDVRGWMPDWVEAVSTHLT